MADLKDDIERYLRGQLSPSEMHALEKKALNDPFLSEALEGASSLSSEHFFSDVIELRHRMRDKKKRTSPLVISLRIAASVAILVVVTYGVYVFTKVDDVIPIAEQNPAAQPPAPSAKGKADSLLASANEKEKQKKNLLSLGPVASTPSPLPEKEQTQPATKPTPPLEIADVRKTDATTEDAKKTEQAFSSALQKEEPVNPKASETVIQEEVVANQPRKDVTDDKAKVAVRERAGAGLASNISNQVINGKVTDSQSGEPIPGANILIQGTTVGTVSDSNGNYQVTTNNTADKLVVSMIGFETKEVPVPTGKNQLDVQLPADVSKLSEVVVTGYAPNTSNTAGRDADESVQLAEPVAGRSTFNAYLEQNLRYPRQAIEKKIEGRVTLEFAVQPDGKLSDFSIVRGLEGGCNDEVIRLVKEGPAWKPSSQGGVPVKSTVRVRVRFKLPK